MLYLLSKEHFQFETSKNKSYLHDYLKDLSGTQPNRIWQEGRTRRLQIHNDRSVSLTTSFMGLDFARLNIQLNANINTAKYHIKGEAVIAKGAWLIAFLGVTFMFIILKLDFHLLVKAPLYGLMCYIYYKTFSGIYRDRSDLVNDVMRLKFLK